MRILITGGTGFIGRCLVPKLIREHAVCCLARKTIEPWQGGTFIRADLRRPLPIALLPEKADAIIHLAGVFGRTDPAELLSVNSVSTLRLLEYARTAGASQFILASSGGVYGYRSDAIGENSRPNPDSLYGLSKYVSERLVALYRRHFRIVVLRLFFPYGLGQTNGLIPTLLSKIENGQPIQIQNDGQPKINPIYVDDLTEVVLRAMRRTAAYSVFNVAGREITDILGLSRTLAGFVGREPRFERVERPDVSNLVADISRMRESLGYEPKMTLGEGLGEVVRKRMQEAG